MASFYPLFLQLAGRLCVVVGGGRVAERKVQGLIAAEATVRVVSPEVTRAIRRLVEEGLVEVVEREYRRGDLKGAVLAFAATDKREINEMVRTESLELKIPLNVADSPAQCDFIVPSVVRKGAVSIAISTSGLLPGLSKRLKEDLEQSLAADYAVYARRVAAFRKHLLEHVQDSRERRDILKAVAGADIAEIAGMSLTAMKKRFLKEPE